MARELGILYMDMHIPEKNEVGLSTQGERFHACSRSRLFNYMRGVYERITINTRKGCLGR